MEDFVQTVRAVEDILCFKSTPDHASSKNITTRFQRAAEDGDYSDEIKCVLADTVPVLLQMVDEYGSREMLHRFSRPGREPLTTKYVYLLPTRPIWRTEGQCSFMDVIWQGGDHPNPADAKDGPQGYDDHLYYSFGVSLTVARFQWNVAEHRDHRASPIPTQSPT